MPFEDRSDFDHRLAELSNWQIEQQKKLRAFQEAQKRLLDLEHQNVLSTLKTQNFDIRKDRVDERHSINFSQKEKSENDPNTQDSKNYESVDIFQLQCQSVKLDEPKVSLFNKINQAQLNQNNPCNGFSLEEKEINQPRKFLKRGDGLARFRMTLDDFKGAPKIYKEKRIKTYLNGRPENVKSNKFNKPSKKPRNLKNCGPKIQNKSEPVSVKIYMPEVKNNKCEGSKNQEVKQIRNVQKPYSLPKSAAQNLFLRPHTLATEWYNVMKEKKSDEKYTSTVNTENYGDTSALDIENKKDEKELQIFEILEKKVNDSSFCSTSSFVDKLMEQSLTSTPSKPCSNDRCSKSYVPGLKSLCNQFLDEQQMKKLDELYEFDSKETVIDSNSGKGDVIKAAKDQEIILTEDIPEEQEVKSDEEIIEAKLEEKSREKIPEKVHPHKVNKMLLQEYIKDFKKFKADLAKNAHRLEEEKEPEESIQHEQQPNKEIQLNHHEIALKLQRKGLQDNVKNLLNWECQPRKKQAKRVVKKVKPKPIRSEKSKVDKGQSEKIIFNSALLKSRLEELEKEIEIFRKENKNLEKLQKECNEERIKISKERKEFEKQMQEEKENFEAKMMEEQKKLQKERMVFEKYCKQVKSQPTRQEREETVNLKKEIEKLTETLSTKEARWGASQARLRNQLKNLEKENTQLKAENEKYKKSNTKKVSFENDKNLNSKIIHVINSELEKLKPAVIKHTSKGVKNLPLSARIERHVEEKPIRRIKSVPNIKRHEESEVCAEVSNDYDDRGLGSVSTDSGIETNGSRYTAQSRMSEDMQARSHHNKVKNVIVEMEKENSLGSPEYEHLCEFSRSKKIEECGDNYVESAVQEAIFRKNDTIDIHPKLLEIKNRIEKLNLYNKPEKEEIFSQKSVRLSKQAKQNSCAHSDSDEANGSFIEDEEENDIEIIECNGKTRSQNKEESLGSPLYPSINPVIERSLGENGVWEKVYEDGSKEITYPNGNVKKIFPGSKIVKMIYYNGDIKETNIVEGSEKYYYAETKTWHTTYKDGLEVLEFPNGQTERRYANGSTEISFPNGCVRYCDSSGRDELRFVDGTVIKTNESGHKILLMPNGQKEIHTKEFKRREYPDGTVKILYADGTQETRYSSGRVRLKDKDGNLLMDSGGIR